MYFIVYVCVIDRGYIFIIKNFSSRKMGWQSNVGKRRIFQIFYRTQNIYKFFIKFKFNRQISQWIFYIGFFHSFSFIHLQHFPNLQYFSEKGKKIFLSRPFFVWFIQNHENEKRFILSGKIFVKYKNGSINFRKNTRRKFFFENGKYIKKNLCHFYFSCVFFSKK